MDFSSDATQLHNSLEWKKYCDKVFEKLRIINARTVLTIDYKLENNLESVALLRRS